MTQKLALALRRLADRLDPPAPHLPDWSYTISIADRPGFVYGTTAGGTSIRYRSE